MGAAIVFSAVWAQAQCFSCFTSFRIGTYWIDRSLLMRPVFFIAAPAFPKSNRQSGRPHINLSLLDRGLHHNPLVFVCVLIKPHFIIPYFIKIVNKNIIWGGFGDFWSKNDRKNEKN